MKIIDVAVVIAKRGGPFLVVGALLTVFLWTGVKGVNFGTHWDEWLAFEEIARPVETGVFLPHSYNYPSMVFDVGTIALLPVSGPFLVRCARESRPAYFQPYAEIVPKSKAEPLLKVIKSESFKCQLRTIFLVLTSLTGIWVFLAVRACKRSWWEAAFAAAVVFSSWEIAYHARWIAPDALQMQFVALWLWLFALAQYSTVRPLTWLRLSSVAAGLAAGSKYQGGILILPILIHATAIVRTRPSTRPVHDLLNELIRNLAIFGAVFLITTPGFLLEPITFWQSLRLIDRQYSTGHLGYTVHVFGQHGYLVLLYLTTVMASHWRFLAVLVSLAACIGIITLCKNRPRVVFLFLCGPLIYGLVAISFRVMMARNYLLFMPFLALFAARGAFWLGETLANVRWLRCGMVAAWLAIFVADLWFLDVAAKNISVHPSVSYEEIAAYIRNRSKTRFLLSPRIEKGLAKEKVNLDNTTRNPAMADRYILESEEVDSKKLICNRPGQYRYVSGPRDVNMDYYPDWANFGKAFDLSIERARKMHALPVQKSE